MKRSQFLPPCCLELSIGLSIFFLMSCSSAPPPAVGPSAAEIELAIFNCKKNVQDKKKERLARVARKVLRVLGENQVLRFYQSRPPLNQLRGAIAKFPLEGDSASLWRTKPEAQARTVSGSLRKTESEEFLSLIFGQPGQEFTAPIPGLRSGGGHGREISISEIDEHHVFISAWDRRDNKDPRALMALVRTYRQQVYAEESETILSDYPVYGDGFSDEMCDGTSM